MPKAHQNTTIDETYPHHEKALKIAGIAPNKFPTFQELENLRTTTTKEERDEEKREKYRRRERQTFFCIQPLSPPPNLSGGRHRRRCQTRFRLHPRLCHLDERGMVIYSCVFLAYHIL